MQQRQLQPMNVPLPGPLKPRRPLPLHEHIHAVAVKHQDAAIDFVARQLRLLGPTFSSILLVAEVERVLLQAKYVHPAFEVARSTKILNNFANLENHEDVQ